MDEVREHIKAALEIVVAEMEEIHGTELRTEPLPERYNMLRDIQYCLYDAEEAMTTLLES